MYICESQSQSGGKPILLFWPVQVYKVEKEPVHFVYIGSGHVGSIPKASINDPVPFTDDNVKIMKLDNIHSTKLKNALKFAKDYIYGIYYVAKYYQRGAGVMVPKK